MKSPTPHTIRCSNCHGSSADWLPGQRGVKWTVHDIRETDKGTLLCSICRQYPGQPIKAGPYHEHSAVSGQQATHRRAA